MGRGVVYDRAVPSSTRSPAAGGQDEQLTERGSSHKSVPSVQGALFAGQKDLEGLRGFKTPQLNGRKDAVTCFQARVGALFPPETFSVNFITCSRASAWQHEVLFGNRVKESAVLPATDRFCFVYVYFTGFGLTVLSPE